MDRLFENNLYEWKNNMTKPLMVIGVRQIGKTYTISKFCKENFNEVLYFNLEKNEAVKNIFENYLDSEKILEELELNIGRKIDLENTVFFFDEVQVSERFIMSLKYFCESPKNYKIICAGSLLGVKLNRFNSSFPVGKIKIEYMYPMDFEEFLMALNKNMLIDKIKECYKENKPMPDFAHQDALYWYKRYLCIGGMPESINNFIENECDILRYDAKILNNLIDMYIADMNKYTISHIESVKIEKIYKNVPIQLAKENKKFKYSDLEKGAKKRAYETAIDWLLSGNMIFSCNNVSKPEIPLKVFADEECFKLYLSDIGMLVCLSEVNFIDIIQSTSFMYRGAITENYVAQELKSKGISLYYWKNKSEAEIDFLLYNEDGIIPVEVKASDNTHSKSLNSYMLKYNPKYGIRVSTKNFGFENNIKSVPLYGVFCLNGVK